MFKKLITPDTLTAKGVEFCNRANVIFYITAIFLKKQIACHFRFFSKMILLKTPNLFF